METEVKLIEMTLGFSRLANEWANATSVAARASIIGRAIPTILRVAYLELVKAV